MFFIYEVKASEKQSRSNLKELSYNSCIKNKIANGKISSIKAGKNEHIMSLMDDEDRVIAVGSWVNEKKDGKCLHNNYIFISLIYNQALLLINLLVLLQKQ